MFDAKAQRRAELINKKLKEIYPLADTVLTWSNPWELTVAVILSAQATDKKINEITQKLFKKYPHIKDYANANVEEFQDDIKQSGFYKQKTKYIVESAKKIIREYDGRVPQTMEELTQLPGVARKTANIILDRAYGKVEGVAVDTHVKRLSLKYKLTNEIDPNKIEKDLMKLFPRKDWMDLNHRLVMYGREYSPAHKKDLKEDPISQELIKNNLL